MLSPARSDNCSASRRPMATPCPCSNASSEPCLILLETEASWLRSSEKKSYRERWNQVLMGPAGAGGRRKPQSGAREGGGGGGFSRGPLLRFFLPHVERLLKKNFFPPRNIPATPDRAPRTPAWV